MKIMFLNGAMTGQTIDLPPHGTKIGRESDNSIHLPMGGVSRYHAAIDCDASGRWLIRDLGSTNGTLVDDVPVEGAMQLVNGSVITIGDQLLRCLDTSNPASPPSAPVPPQMPPQAPLPAQPQAVSPQPQPQAPQPQPVPAQSAQPESGQQGNQGTFFFRPQNVSRPSPASTAQIQETLKSAPQPQPQSQPAAPSAPTVPAISTEVPLFNKKQGKAQQANRPKKMLGNIIFALLVIVAAIVGLGVFLKLNESPQKPPAQTSAPKPENPFVLYYEKEAISGKSVFRFVLQIEMLEKENPDDHKKTRGYYMEVMLDEPQNKRQYSERFNDPLPDKLIEKLKQQITESGFMDLQQEKIAGTSQDNRQSRRIMVGFGSKFCDVRVSNDVSETFNRVEDIINETVLDEYDLGVISQSVDRILSDAERFLFEADGEFASIDTTPSNLPKAISHYRLALHRYQLFEPKPDGWTAAHDGLAKAEAKQEEMHQEGLKNVRLFYELREYDKAIAECNRLLDIFPPDSPTYQAIRENKIKIEKKMSARSN